MVHEDITNVNVVGYILYGIGTIMATLLVLNYVQETEIIYYFFFTNMKLITLNKNIIGAIKCEIYLYETFQNNF
jgi:hypothetical protein